MPGPFIILCLPLSIIVIIKPLCFHRRTKVKVLEGGKIVEKDIKDVKSGDMVLSQHGDKVKMVKVDRNEEVEGEFDFFVFKLKSSEGKSKELSVTENHIMIVYDENGENMRLAKAKDIKQGEHFWTEDGLMEISEIQHEKDDKKYNLVVEQGTIYASGVFVSSLCVDNLKDLKVLDPSTKEFKSYEINFV